MNRLSRKNSIRSGQFLQLARAATKSITARGFLEVLFALLILINGRSFPLAWHVRVLTPALKFKARYLAFKARHALTFGSAWNRAEASYYENVCPIGLSPFDQHLVYRSYAGIDDCDFYGHLSNSSYAKTLDAARMKAAIEFIPHFARAGGWLALAATYFHYIREIPSFVEYEVRVSIVTWDEKWAFIAGRFVTKAKETKLPTLDANNRKETDSSQPEFIPTNDVLRSLALKVASESEPDGATLHCVTISQFCLKHGRITVPLGLVYASHGCSQPRPETGSSNSRKYSQADPPPHWKHIRSKITAGGDLSELIKFWTGGWRDLPEGERWWDDALGGNIEAKRKENLEKMLTLKSSLEAVKEITRE